MGSSATKKTKNFVMELVLIPSPLSMGNPRASFLEILNVHHSSGFISFEVNRNLYQCIHSPKWNQNVTLNSFCLFVLFCDVLFCLFHLNRL